MTDVQIAVGLGRKPGLDGAVFAAGQIFVDDVADKMVIGKLFFIHGNSNIFQTGMVIAIDDACLNILKGLNALF